MQQTEESRWRCELPGLTKQHSHYKLHCLQTNLLAGPIHFVSFHK